MDDLWRKRCTTSELAEIAAGNSLGHRPLRPAPSQWFAKEGVLRAVATGLTGRSLAKPWGPAPPEVSLRRLQCVHGGETWVAGYMGAQLEKSTRRESFHATHRWSERPSVGAELNRRVDHPSGGGLGSGCSPSFLTDREAQRRIRLTGGSRIAMVWPLGHRAPRPPWLSGGQSSRRGQVAW